MLQINGKNWVNLDPYIDTKFLDDKFEDICLAVGKNHRHIRPASHGVDNTLSKDIPEMMQILSDLQKDPELKKDVNPHQMYFYSLYKEKSWAMNYLLLIRNRLDSNYALKHISDHTTINFPPAKDFKFFTDWINDQKIFDSVGRIVVFLREAKTVENSTASNHVHTDYVISEMDNYRDQFVWFNFTPGKSFYIYDVENGEKDYVTSRAAYFNSFNYHGIENPTRPCISMRVDGVFSSDFLEKAGMKDYFQ